MFSYEENERQQQACRPDADRHGCRYRHRSAVHDGQRICRRRQRPVDLHQQPAVPGHHRRERHPGAWSVLRLRSVVHPRPADHYCSHGLLFRCYRHQRDQRSLHAGSCVRKDHRLVPADQRHRSGHGRRCGTDLLRCRDVQRGDRGCGSFHRFHRLQPPDGHSEHHPQQYHRHLRREQRRPWHRIHRRGHRPVHERSENGQGQHHLPSVHRNQQHHRGVSELHRQEVRPRRHLHAAVPHLRDLRHQLPEARAGLCGTVRGSAAGVSVHRLSHPSGPVL